jgi:hypothetical protein
MPFLQRRWGLETFRRMLLGGLDVTANAVTPSTVDADAAKATVSDPGYVRVQA